MYLKDKGLDIHFRIDQTTYTLLRKKFDDTKRIVPKLTFSEYLRSVLVLHARK